jgi:hypothetical protein
MIRRLSTLLALLVALSSPAQAATFSANPGAINSRSIASVRSAVKKIVAAGNVPAGWTGNVATGNAGTTSRAYQVATLKSINIVRKLAGLNPVVFDIAEGAKCAQAALMMSANRQLNHNPPASWQHFSAEGQEAAGKSNLFLGFAGAFTVPGYMDDSGVGNERVGHRRWLLWSQSLTMATGDVLGGGSFLPANAIWVVNPGSPTPSVRGGFVAWPYAGAIPNTLVFQRWSFGVPNADFSGATVRVKLGKKNIPVTIVDRTFDPLSIVGDNTIVFRPKQSYTPAKFGTIFYQSHLKPPRKPAIYTVTVSNVLVGGTPRNFTYRVKVFAM